MTRPSTEFLSQRDDELLDAAKDGDCVRLTACIKRNALLSIIRDPYGASAIHLAVTSGSTEAVILLLDAGAFIDSNDWRMATPLYYACTHRGQDGVFEKDEERRSKMIRCLVSRGADTMQQSGFTGKSHGNSCPPKPTER